MYILNSFWKYFKKCIHINPAEIKNINPAEIKKTHINPAEIKNINSAERDVELYYKNPRYCAACNYDSMFF